MPSKVRLHYIAYDPFDKEITSIRNWLRDIQIRINEQLKREPIPYPLMSEDEKEINPSAIAEAALIKMGSELKTNPLGLDQWNAYYIRYQEAAKEVPENDNRSHAGEQKVWISESSGDQIINIIQAAQRAGVTFPLYHRKNAPRFRLVIGLAIMYTADRLPALPN